MYYLLNARGVALELHDRLAGLLKVEDPQHLQGPGDQVEMSCTVCTAGEIS